MNKVPITKAGFERLKKELDQLKGILIPENIRDIEAARAQGDLSENAEYTAAKERQSYLHGRSSEIENNLAMSQIVEVGRTNADRVVFGCCVTVQDTDTGKEIRYQLVGPFESDISANKISVTSPIGKALIGKCIGALVNFKAPGGEREIEIVDIDFDED
jgi:transcription elongation factor GreA